MVNVILVDDDEMSCELLKKYINESERYKCVMATTEVNGIKECIERGNIELILLDICSTLNECGFEIAKKYKEIFPHLKIIIMTKYPEYSYIRRAMESKADSFWYKVAEEDELIDIMDKTMGGTSIYPRKTLSVKFGNVLSEELTEREVEVLRELVRGETDTSIANHIHMSLRSVKGYIQSMRNKTGCRNRTELAVNARALGLIINRQD